jgi:hypothetical protein
VVLTRCAALLAMLLFSSCAYRVPTTAYGPKPDDPFYAARQKAVESPIYKYIPRNRDQLPLLDLRWLTWCVGGNENDGIFGEHAGTAPFSTNINFGTYCRWSILRNPLHNFDFYVIGSADWKRHYNFSLLSAGGAKPVRAFSNTGKRQRGDRPFFDLGFNDFKPYLNFDPWICDLYLGWRRNGSFEIKLRKKSESEIRRRKQTDNRAGINNRE